MERITSPANERLKRARRLSRRRARSSSGLFLVEGEDGVGWALDAGIEPVEVLVDAERPPPPALADRVAARTALVEPPLLADLGSLGHPARILGVFRAADLPPSPSTPPPVALELHGVGDPGNVGTLVRSLAALGPGVLRLGPACADPLGAKALRASMGAVFAVPVEHVGDGEGVPPAAAGGTARRVALDARGRPLPGEDLRAPVVFLLGAEREGLPPEILAGADAVCRIPQEAEVDSLNVAMAGTVALYEARRQRLGLG